MLFYNAIISIFDFFSHASLQFIPDYDRKTASISTTFAEYAFHEDMNVTSRLLDNLRVSFYWRNLIRSDLIADFRRWASNDNGTQAPDFILLGGFKYFNYCDINCVTILFGNRYNSSSLDRKQ